MESDRIAALQGVDGKLQRIQFRGGGEIARVALFFDTPCRPQSELARTLGCELNANGGIRCGQYEASSVPGVFVAGNILKDVQLSIVAAAEGARAAFGINRALTREDFSTRAGLPRAVDHPGPDARRVTSDRRAKGKRQGRIRDYDDLVAVASNFKACA